MAKKDKEQSTRFIEKAEELGSDESGRLFDRAFNKIVPQLKHERKKPKEKTNQDKVR